VPVKPKASIVATFWYCDQTMFLKRSTLPCAAAALSSSMLKAWSSTRFCHDERKTPIEILWDPKRSSTESSNDRTRSGVSGSATMTSSDASEVSMNEGARNASA
jgi:hypothetical protein